jgi:hypothetical protein
MTTLSDLREKLLQNPALRAEYEALEWRGNRLEPITTPKPPQRPQSDQEGPAYAQDCPG